MNPDDDDEGRRRWVQWVIIGLVLCGVVAGAVWLFSSGDTKKPQFRLDDGSGSVATAGTATSSLPSEVDTAPFAAAQDTLAIATTSPTTSAAAITSTVAVTTTAAVPTTAATPATAVDTTTTIGAPTTAAAASPATNAQAAVVDYPINADGSPVPVLCIYDTDSITLTGAVPSVESKQRLETLALANAQSPAPIVDDLTINPNVPIGIGVRVIELNSARFPSGSSKVLPAHAAELNRVAAAMKALPNVTVQVIGHADQLGNTASNIVISSERAHAVVDYLTFVGVDPSRLSARAAGASDLLTSDADAASLALNRRTEFILYGLLVV